VFEERFVFKERILPAVFGTRQDIIRKAAGLSIVFCEKAQKHFCEKAQKTLDIKAALTFTLHIPVFAGIYRSGTHKRWKQ